jgi:hypothetical protein
MRHSTGKPTKAEQARFSTIKDSAVCVCCHQLGLISSYVEIHHILSGSRRIGHMATVGLCPWHHRAVPLDGHTKASMRSEYGFSLAEGSKPFRGQFGSDAELLAYQDAMLDSSMCMPQDK